jgi:DNA polymerase-3 subunit gamma/tau
MEGRHVDVIEMDAASHTGIDDIREIIEQVRYRPVSARYKVYIIDEVHMLSNQAFNGLLKTLEEPPAHVKFIFATTEIRKVPITVLSRCQRFDLRRIDSGLLVAHFKNVADQEGIAIDDESLAMIARAAEGSVRDGLSLLDQAIAHGGGSVDAEAVRSMLGLADRSRIVGLFGSLMAGDVAGALASFRDQYDSGAGPSVILTDLADFTHLVTRLKFVPEAGQDPSLTETERESGADYAAKLSTVILSRVWQMLLKGISETDTSSRPAAAAEMALIRIAHAANLPSPEDALKAFQNSGGGSAEAGGQQSGSGSSGGGATARAVGERRMPQCGNWRRATVDAPCPFRRTVRCSSRRFRTGRGNRHRFARGHGRAGRETSRHRHEGPDSYRRAAGPHRARPSRNQSGARREPQPARRTDQETR